MKSALRILTAIVLLAAATSTFAGPYYGATTIQGSGQPISFSIPPGAVVTILNFVCTDVSNLSVSVNGKAAQALTSTDLGNTPAANGKDLVIPGPATLSITVLPGNTAYLSYKLTNNG